LWMALKRTAKNSRATTAGERLDDYLNVRVARNTGDVNVQYSQAILQKMPSVAVFHGVGNLSGLLPGIGAVRWSTSNYPHVVVGVNGMLSGGLVPIYTWDGGQMRTRYARFVTRRVRGAGGGLPSFYVGFRIESCVECNAWPRDKGYRANVQMCVCADLKMVPHIGACGIGHAPLYPVACCRMSELPPAMIDAICSWRPAPHTYCYDYWAMRKEAIHGLGHGFIMSSDPPTFDLNMSRFLDPELRDFHLSRGERFVEPGQYGYRHDLRGENGEMVQPDDYIRVGACSDLMELFDGIRVRRISYGDDVVVYMDSPRDQDQEL